MKYAMNRYGGRPIGNDVGSVGIETQDAFLSATFGPLQVLPSQVGSKPYLLRGNAERGLAVAMIEKAIQDAELPCRCAALQAKRRVKLESKFGTRYEPYARRKLATLESDVRCRNCEHRASAREWLRDATMIFSARFCFEAMGVNYEAAIGQLEKRWRVE